MAILNDKTKLSVLILYCLNNSKPIPIYNSSNNTVTVPEMSDAQILAITDPATTQLITDSQKMVDLSGFNVTNKKPTGDVAILKNWAKQSTTSMCSYLRQKATKAADSSVVAGWVDKMIIAEKVNSSTANATEIAVLQTEADARGLSETPAQLATIIIAKANALRTARGKIDGFEDKILTDIGNSLDENSVNVLMTAAMASAVIIYDTL